MVFHAKEVQLSRRKVVRVAGRILLPLGIGLLAGVLSGGCGGGGGGGGGALRWDQGQWDQIQWG